MSAIRTSPTHDRVTGRLKFVDDIELDGVLHGSFVRVPHSRAGIDSIETDVAATARGVVRIFTAADFGEEGPPRFGPLVMDQPVLAVGETKYFGEPVALVVADTSAHARAGARLVRVHSRPMAGWHTVTDALSNQPLHDPRTRSPEQAPWRDTNVMAAWDFGWGDVESDAALILENRYQAPFAHHFPIETHSAVAMPDGRGITVWDTVQHPFQERRVIAAMLDLPLSMVRVQAVNMGGSFGSKGYPKLGPVVALFSRLLGRPLKITLSGEESFLTAQREASDITVRTGFDDRGVLVFQDISADFMVGAYTDISPRVVSKAGFLACGPYHTPAARIRARGIFTTTPPTTAFRGFGAPHIVMAIEGQMDEAAHHLGIDPLEIRLRNIKNKGETLVEFETPVDGDWPELLRSAATKLGWETPPPTGRGRGIAFGLKSCVPATESSARIRLSVDGSVTAYVGTSEMGQGAAPTFAQLVGGWLGVDAEQVDLVMADTDRVPFDALTASSRSLVHMGNALEAAADDVKRQIVELANASHGAGADHVDFEGAGMTVGSWSGTVTELLGAPHGPGQGEIVGTGSFAAPADPRHPLGGRTPFFEAVVTAVELSVDVDTGLVDIHKLVHVTDAGKVINSPRAIGLDDGGVVMALGLALSEQLIYTDGGLVNGSSLDYRIPTIADIADETISVFQENRDGPGPQGSKGIAEGGVLAVAPAVAAAVFECTGSRFRRLPITPERIWRELLGEGDQ